MTILRHGILDSKKPVISSIDSSLLLNLMGYWKFDETTDASAYDSINVNHLSLRDVSLGADGVVNTSIKFDASIRTHASRTAANLVDLQNIRNTVSLSLWVKLYTLPSITGRDAYCVNLSNDKGPWSAYRILITTSNIAQFSVSSSDGTQYGTYYIVSGSSAISVDTWYNFTGVYDLSTLKIYQNGSNVSSSTVNYDGSIHVSPYYFTIGNYYNNANNYTTGYIDEVGVWDRALSAEDVSTLYNFGNGLTYPFS